jgi:hypothetical protein
MTPAVLRASTFHGADINLGNVTMKCDLKIPNTTPRQRVAQLSDRVVWFVLPALAWSCFERQIGGRWNWGSIILQPLPLPG